MNLYKKFFFILSKEVSNGSLMSPNLCNTKMKLKYFLFTEKCTKPLQYNSYINV